MSLFVSLIDRSFRKDEMPRRYKSQNNTFMLLEIWRKRITPCFYQRIPVTCRRWSPPLCRFTVIFNRRVNKVLSILRLHQLNRKKHRSNRRKTLLRSIFSLSFFDDDKKTQQQQQQEFHGFSHENQLIRFHFRRCSLLRH